MVGPNDVEEEGTEANVVGPIEVEEDTWIDVDGPVDVEDEGTEADAVVELSLIHI